MMDIRQTHRRAMEQSDLALLARMKGDHLAAEGYSNAAYRLETEAANALLNDLGAEPTRSVLFRSAATLARDCGRFAEAEKLIYRALAGDPPAEIAMELQDLLEQVSFHRHLELRGVTLGEEEIQMAITGTSVGFGMAATDVVLERVRTTETLLYRTGERTLKRPYRDRGRRDGQMSQDLELYMSVPRAACFAVTFRIGASVQQSIPGLSPSAPVIDELFDCLQLYTVGDTTGLKDRIPDEAYYRNFVNLARTLQPDGTKVNMVGFTAQRRGATKQVALTKSPGGPATLSAQDILPAGNDQNIGDMHLVKVSGELQIANATRRSSKQAGEIEIVTTDNERVKVVVPPGMMSDIVKPLWESVVEVVGTRKGNKVHLIQISPAG